MSASQPETVQEHLSASHKSNALEVARITNLVRETEAQVARARAERAAFFNPQTDGAVIGLENDLARFKSALAQRQAVQTNLAERLAELGVSVDEPDDEDDDDKPDAVRSSLTMDSAQKTVRMRMRDESFAIPA